MKRAPAPSTIAGLLLTLLLAGGAGAGCASREGRSAAGGSESPTEPTDPDTSGHEDAAPRLSDGRAAAHAFYESQPLMLRPFPEVQTPTGLADVRASTCGACHQQIYAEWKISTHARAWLDDAQFQEELAKPRENGGDVAWMCVNCHTPLVNQLPQLVTGLRDGALDQPIYGGNPVYDQTLQEEAITCAVCHVREDGVILGPYGDTNAPHPVARADELYSSELCSRCHQAEAHFPELTLACAFTTGEELARGAWSQIEPERADLLPEGVTGHQCQSCHMPLVERPLMPGFPERTNRHHWFGGSMIPKRPQDEADLAPLRSIFRDGLELAWQELPETLQHGETVSLTLRLRNAHAGHLLPTGDPERFLLIDVVARGPDGAEIHRQQERIGAVYQWYPTIEKVSDNRLEPLEERDLTVSFEVPEGGPIELEVVASKWRLTQENLEYHHLEGRTVPGRTFYTATETLSVQ